MRQMGSSIALIAGFALLMAASGCAPFATPAISPDDATAPAAGRYWVDQHDGKLSYFKLAEQRGERGEWITIGATGSAWFAGAGIYETSDAGDWALVPDAGVSSLDELLQLNDAPPGS